MEPSAHLVSGGLLRDMDEGLVRIGLAQEPRADRRAPGDGVAGGEDAAAHRREVRREQHLAAERHLHLGGVAVVEQAVGGEIPVDRVKWVASLSPLPAPLTPEAASTMILSGSIRPSKGRSARLAAVG